MIRRGIPPLGLRPLPATLLAAAFLLTGCSLIGGSGPEPQAPGGSPLAPLPDDAQLFYDDRGGIPDSVRIVVRDPGTWRAQWDRATSERSDSPPLPAVDFERHMVLVVAAGRKSPGDRIQVDSAGVRTERTTEDEHEVFEVVVRTVESCTSIRSDIYPLTIVRVPRFEGPVSFQERVDRTGCDGRP